MLKKLSLSNCLMLLLPVWGVVFVSNFLLFWLFMELFNILYISYYGMKKMQKFFVMFFFIVQSISSLFLLLFFFLAEINFLENISNWGVFLSLFMKMGMVPFHGWALKLVNILNYEDLFMFLMIMKIMPLFMVYSLSKNMFFEKSLLFLNLFYSSLLLFIFNSYKKIIYMSSLSNNSFLMILMNESSKIFLLFFFLYYFISYYLYFFLHESNLDALGSSKKIEDMSFFMLIFSMSGIPYFLGFLMKWNLFKELMYLNSYMYMYMLFFVAIISSIFYFKMIFYLFYNMSNSSMISMHGGKSMKIFFTFFFFFLIFSFVILIYF